MSASYPKVRLATQADIPQVIQLSYDLHKENGLMPVAPDLIAAIVAKALNQDGAILAVIGPVGDVEGLIYLAINCMWYSRDPHLEELFSYVKPEFRRSKNAKALVEFAKASADKIGVPLLIGILSNTDTQRKIKLYERMLGEPVGAFFLHGGTTGHIKAA
jgi:GNAT superfamily N-acetyltransferase